MRISVLCATTLATALLAGPALAQTTASDTHHPRTATETVKQDTKRAGEKSGNAITDSWITMKIHAQFIPEDTLDGSDINVTTKSHVVTLTGTVPSAAGRTRAVEIARATDGVTNVVDKLRIASDADASRRSSRTETTGATPSAREAGRETTGAVARTGHRVTDGWIKSKIYSQYMTEDSLEHSDINLDVVNGVVTVKGTVPSQAGRNRAVDIAKATDGVKSVNDRLRVSPSKKSH